MEIKKLKFTERFIDTKPERVIYWRGITASCDDMLIFRINYFEKKEEIDEKSEFIVTSVISSLEPNTDRKKFYNKEDAMEHCQNIFEIFINKFLE
jgi:hypothetical protein